MATTFRFNADGSGYARGLNQMRGQTKKFASGVKGMLGGAFAVTAIVASMKNLFGEMDRIHKLSLRYGMGAEAIQKLGFAAEQNGTTLEVMAKGLAQANRAAVEAGNGLKTYQRAFDDLGISWETFAELGQEEQLHMIADAFKNAEDKNKALAAAQTLLGRAGLELVPMLQQGSEGIMALTADLKTFTDAEVAAAAKTNDALNKAFTQIKSTMGSWIIEAMNVFKMLAAGGAQAAIEIGDSFGIVGKIIKKAFTGDFKGAIAEVENLMDQAGGAAGRIGDAMDDEVRDQVGGPDLSGDKAKAAAAAAAQAEAELEITKEKKKVLEEIAALEEKAAAEKKKRETSEMTVAERLKQATADRLAIEKEISQLDPFAEENDLTLAKKNLELQGAITAEGKAQSEYDKMRGDEADGIGAAAQDAADAAQEAADKAKEAAEREKEAMQASEVIAEQPESVQTSIIASQLASIGGGGGVSVTTNDPLLNENKRQTQVLERIERQLQGSGGLEFPEL